MMFETEKQKTSIQRWSRLATQLNGAAESGRFDHITTKTIVAELDRERIFEFLASELPAEVWDVCKLSDVDRHQLAKEWALMVRAPPRRIESGPGGRERGAPPGAEASAVTSAFRRAPGGAVRGQDPPRAILR